MATLAAFAALKLSDAFNNTGPGCWCGGCITIPLRSRVEQYFSERFGAVQLFPCRISLPNQRLFVPPPEDSRTQWARDAADWGPGSADPGWPRLTVSPRSSPTRQSTPDKARLPASPTRLRLPRGPDAGRLGLRGLTSCNPGRIRGQPVSGPLAVAGGRVSR